MVTVVVHDLLTNREDQFVIDVDQIPSPLLSAVLPQLRRLLHDNYQGQLNLRMLEDEAVIDALKARVPELIEAGLMRGEELFPRAIDLDSVYWFDENSSVYLATNDNENNNDNGDEAIRVTIPANRQESIVLSVPVSGFFLYPVHGEPYAMGVRVGEFSGRFNNVSWNDEEEQAVIPAWQGEGEEPAASGLILHREDPDVIRLSLEQHAEQIHFTDPQEMRAVNQNYLPEAVQVRMLRELAAPRPGR